LCLKGRIRDLVQPTNNTVNLSLSTTAEGDKDQAKITSSVSQLS
jgi:hypothetical protein